MRRDGTGRTCTGVVLYAREASSACINPEKLRRSRKATRHSGRLELSSTQAPLQRASRSVSAPPASDAPPTAPPFPKAAPPLTEGEVSGGAAPSAERLRLV